jgi:hypothetical protein
MLEVVGASGLGLVWGWLLILRGRKALRDPSLLLALVVISLLVAGAVGVLASVRAALITGASAAVGAWVHASWLEHLSRQLRRGAER